MPINNENVEKLLDKWHSENIIQRIGGPIPSIERGEGDMAGVENMTWLDMVVKIMFWLSIFEFIGYELVGIYIGICVCLILKFISRKYNF